MGTWTTQQVEALAPDASSAKAGKGLATASKWRNLGFSPRAVWGECQGSGKDPYQTQVDLSEPAFRCSCPSRKFPCKHGLGLMLLFAAQPTALSEGNPPEWVAAWLESRIRKADEKAEKQAQRVERSAQPVDQLAQARRAAQREERVAAGLNYVDTWLQDMMRSGLASLPSQPYAYWDTPAARMIDAQAPGVGRMIRELSAIPASGEGWQERLLERAGKLFLLLEGFRHLNSLPPETQADIRALIGWNVSQEDLLNGTAEEEVVADRWLVLGQRVLDEDRIRVQRTWLWGRNTHRSALLLQFAAFGQALDQSLVPGSGFEGELVFYPGAFPLRALIRSRKVVEPNPELPSGWDSITTALSRHTEAQVACPWLSDFPLLLRQVGVVKREAQWLIGDGDGYALPIAPAFTRIWHLLAFSGGRPFTAFGEWNGDSLLPVSVWTEDGFHQIAVAHG